MPISAARATGAIARRNRNSGPMSPLVLPITEILVTAECWHAATEAEAVIQRAIATAAEIADADVGEAELAVMLTDDAGIRTLRCRRSGARGDADRRCRHPHAQQQLARHRQADQCAVVSGAAADRTGRARRRAADAWRHRDRL